VSARRPIGATYRLQIRDVGFDGAVAVVPYLASLGIATLYTSPIFTARSGSTHGYDVIDPTVVDPALGGDAGLARLLAALEEAGMNLLVDIVPNHLALDPQSPLVAEMLTTGQRGPAGEVFDIDWEDGRGQIVLPVLGSPLVEAAAEGTVTIGAGDGVVEAGGTSWPLAHRADRASRVRGPARRGRATGPGAEVLAPLDAQHFRLAWWRLRTTALNYRRFFEVDDLIALRQEDSAVFARTHRGVVEVARDPRVGGVRVDHVDGLADPKTYLERLAAALGDDDRPAVVVEKILGREELLPRWRTDGTTGYDFAALAVGLFVDPVGATVIARGYRERTGDPRNFAARRRDAKSAVLDDLFPAQLDRTARAFVDAIARERPGVDLVDADVRRAVAALIVHLDVYRTYGVGAEALRGADLAWITRALEGVCTGAGTPAEIAQRAAVPGDPSELVRAASIVADLLRRGGDTAPGEVADARRRFEQLASAVMAKGGEDTALFAAGTPLVAAEVGADPDAPSTTVAEFHAAMVARAQRPGSLNATSTHDSKRSEDVRTRLAALSGAPDAWLVAVDRWHRRHRAARGSVLPEEEMYCYESIVGIAERGATTSPELRRRITRHLIKAAREAKVATSWSDPDTPHERDLAHFVRALLGPENTAFHRDLDRLLGRVEPIGRAYALALTVAKVAAPGVPDVYQGTEGGIASLTDPDNRRKVPFRALAREQRARGRGPVPRDARRGALDVTKLATTAAALGARRARPELFTRGRYVPIPVPGPDGARIVAFARTRGRDVALCCFGIAGSTVHDRSRSVGRVRATGVLDLPAAFAGRYRDVLCDVERELSPGPTSIAELLSDLPAALLLRVPS
jgi:(1->4)-alpha-D-glucan 1-alpha-D-glucosylmutase